MVGLRQVGVVGADRSVAAVTGGLCVDHAGHVVGDGFVAAANMAATADVWPAMASAFVGTSGPLARRLLGRSPPVRKRAVMPGGACRRRCWWSMAPWSSLPTAGTVVDLRVDRSDDPIGDLGRLLDAADAYAAFHRVVDQLSVGEPGAALDRLNDALRILPDDHNLRFARAGALLGVDVLEEATSELRSLVAERPTWELVIRSFVAKAFINLPANVSIDSLLHPTP